MAIKLVAPLIGLFLIAACGSFANSPDSIEEIEKSFGVKICDGSTVRIVDNLGIVEPAPVYEIEFQSDKCVDDFLKSVVADASHYEHPFGDKSKILGSSDRWRTQFHTIREGRHVTYFVSSTKWLAEETRKQ